MDSLYLATQILLAEDNRADIELVRKALREHKINCDLHIISDGEDALAFIDQLDLDSKLTCPNVMLLDLHLPKCDGLQLLKHLRSSERCGNRPVVVFA